MYFYTKRFLQFYSHFILFYSKKIFIMELAWNGAVKLTNINNLACLVAAVFHPRVETSPLTLRLAPMVTRQTNNPNQGNIPGSQF